MRVSLPRILALMVVNNIVSHDIVDITLNKVEALVADARENLIDISGDIPITPALMLAVKAEVFDMLNVEASIPTQQSEHPPNILPC